MAKKATQNVNKKVRLLKMVAVFLCLVFAFTFGLVLGGWQQTEKFREHLEEISDINQCYGT
jgi:TRAP-type C4-dicarboxylate transport system permease small subunit